MIIPNPALVTKITQIPDEDDDVVSQYVTTAWDDATNTFDWGPRRSQLGPLTADGSTVSGLMIDAQNTEHGLTVRFVIRPVDPYDAVALSRAGVPQPVRVVRAHILRGGGILAEQLDAVVAADNTVATLMLETGLGTYVRLGGDWQELSPESTSLDNLSLVQVGGAAVDVYDAAESAGTTLTVFDLPVPSANDPTIMVEPGTAATEIPGLPAEVASAVPMVASAADVEMAVRFAESFPSARWYVLKRARAVGASALVPKDWDIGTARHPQIGGLHLDSPEAVRTFAGLFNDLASVGNYVGRDAYVGLVAAARDFGMLDDPAITSAAHWHAEACKGPDVVEGPEPTEVLDLESVS